MRSKTPEHDKLVVHFDEFFTLSLFADYLTEKHIDISQDDILVFLGIDPLLFSQEISHLNKIHYS